MVTINFLLTIISSICLLVIIGLSSFDSFKNRKLKPKNNPQLTFVIPCYNAGETIENTIKSIYETYNNSKIIVINDKSTDNTLEILKNLAKTYNFEIIENEINKGKVKSLNQTIPLIDTEIFFIIDADVILNKKAIEEVLARFQANEKVGAVSCKYIAKNKGFFPAMQDIEYNMYSLVQTAHNLFSTYALWGGCMAFRKKAFLEAGNLSENAIAEDLDMAFKMNRNKWKVEQTHIGIHTIVPSTFKSWWKQKKRWTSGFMQCFIKYFLTWIKSPLYIIFMFSYFFLVFGSILGLINGAIFYNHIYDTYSSIKLATMGNFSECVMKVWEIYDIKILKGILYKFIFAFFAIPYVIMMIKKKKETYKLLYIFPFSFIYAPLYITVSIYGWCVYFRRHKELNAGERGW